MPELGEVRKGTEIGKRSVSKHIYHACEDCGKCRWVRLLKNGEPRSELCKSCSLKGRIFTEEWKAKLSIAKKGCHLTEKHKANLCIARKERIGEKAPCWKGGEVKRICLNCGEIFYVDRWEIKKRECNFCSKSCHMIYQRKQGDFNSKPNKPESQLIELLERNSLPFKYVGGGEVWLGNRNPDFIGVNGKKQVIELLGIYWHPLFDGADRIEHYKRYGFDCLVVWEDELADIPKLTTKVKRFANDG